MKVEIPTLNRCCCCLPLRPGLLAWVYVKLAIALLLTALFIIILIETSERGFSSFQIMLTCSLLLLALEIPFNIFFLINGHRKNFEHLKIYYRYALVILGFEGLSFIGYIFFEFYTIYYYPLVIFFLKFLVETTCFALVLILLQIYFILLIQSEIRKLEDNAKFEFVNHTATEPQCKAQIIV